MWAIKKCESLLTISSEEKKIKDTATLLPRLLLMLQSKVEDTVLGCTKI